MTDQPPLPAPEHDPDAARQADAESHVRIFLVVCDDSPELKVALRYACLRARKSAGRVALLYVMEPAEMQSWLALENLMREEQRSEAEQKLQKLAREVIRETGTLPALIIREGNRRDELMSLMEEDPKISILVLAASSSTEGPGPLIAHLTGRGLPRLRIPMTIVPAGLTDDQLDAIT